MAITFPASPTNGQTFTSGNKTWQWDGTTWLAYGASLSPSVLKVDSANARVGVNNQSPAYALDVNGTIEGTQFLQGTDYLSPYQGFRNAIINGDFRINQRGFTSSTTSSLYGFDRWVVVHVGGTCTQSAQTFTVGSPAATGYESANYLQFVTASQSAASDFAKVRQFVEDVRTFANSTVTVSFWAKATSGTPKVALELNQGFGSGGSPSAEVNVYGGQVTLSTSWARYSVTVAVPSISGKTIGTTANTSSFGIDFWTSSGSTYNARSGSLGIQNNTFHFWGVQVERGSVATPFEQRPIQQELALCQRYYQPICNLDGSEINTGIALSATDMRIGFFLKQSMRIVPVMESTTGSAYWIIFSSSPSNATGTLQTTFDASSSQHYVQIVLTLGTGITAGNAILFRRNNVAARIAASAEL